MQHHNLLKLASAFYSIASTEKLPPNSDNLSTITKNLDNLCFFKSRIEYCEKNLEHLSSGSSRIVYKTSKNTVIKLAKNEKGISQNEVEASAKTKSKHVNPVLSHSKNYFWIEVPLLEKITTKEFEALCDLSFEDFSKSLEYGLKHLEHSSQKKPSKFDSISKSSLYKNIFDVAKKLNLLPGDLTRISSWGTKNKVPVLIDVGLSRKVYEEHYSSSSSGDSTKSTKSSKSTSSKKTS